MTYKDFYNIASYINNYYLSIGYLRNYFSEEEVVEFAHDYKSSYDSDKSESRTCVLESIIETLKSIIDESHIDNPEVDNWIETLIKEVYKKFEVVWYDEQNEVDNFKQFYAEDYCQADAIAERLSEGNEYTLELIEEEN